MADQPDRHERAKATSIHKWVPPPDPSPAASPGVDKLVGLIHTLGTPSLLCSLCGGGAATYCVCYAVSGTIGFALPTRDDVARWRAENPEQRRSVEELVFAGLAAERQQHTAQIAELAQDVTFLEGQVEASALGLMSFRAEVDSLTQQLELQQRFTRSAEQSFLTTKEQLTEAQIALDDIGAPRADGMGELTITGRCWALSQRWAEEQANLQTQIATLREGWQPIETAPKDRLILGALVFDGRICRVHEMRHNGLAFYTTAGGSLPRMTHWAPMPALAAPRTGEQP